MDDKAVLELYTKLNSWHKQRIGQLQLIVDRPADSISVDDTTIEAGSDLHRGVRFGVGLALYLLGELPIKIGTEGD